MPPGNHIIVGVDKSPEIIHLTEMHNVDKLQPQGMRQRIKKSNDFAFIKAIDEVLSAEFSSRRAKPFRILF